MKVGRIICTAVLVVLCVLGWSHQVTSGIGMQNEWSSHVEEAQDYASRGLSQRAIQSYEQALSIREDGEVRREYLDVCALAYEEGTIKRSAYKKALEASCQADPKSEAAWVRLIELLRDSSNYQEAYKTLGKAGRAGAAGETLAALSREITYAFTAGSQRFADYYAAPHGSAAILNGDRWGVISADGQRVYSCDYLYISPYSSDGTAVFRTDSSTCLLDRSGVIQAILEEEISEARAYGSGLLPVRQSGQWRYLDCESGAYAGGQYEDASSYQNGWAAVCQNGTWTLIDPTGRSGAEQVFSDLRLYGNGTYSYDGLFSAAVGGVWRIYRLDGGEASAVSSEFTAADLDLYYGEAVAFQDSSGLWGFVDKKGKVLVEPQYLRAKSFSCGLAAVYDGEAWGFINEDGELAIDYQFLDTGYFTDKGVCPVSTVEGEYYMIILRFPKGT